MSMYRTSRVTHRTDRDRETLVRDAMQGTVQSREDARGALHRIAHSPVSCSEIIPFVGPCKRSRRPELTMPRARAISPILYLGISVAAPDRPIVLYVARGDLTDPVLANRTAGLAWTQSNLRFSVATIRILIRRKRDKERTKEKSRHAKLCIIAR